MTSRDSILLAVLGIPLIGLAMAGAYLFWQRWQIYRRIGNYSIGLVTFFTQLDYPAMNFPGPNILEANIAAQPAELQAYIQVVRRRVRYMRWGVVSYVGFFLVFFLVRKLSS